MKPKKQGHYPKKPKETPLQRETAYVAFLQKRLASQNFRQNEPAEVVAKTEKKLDKAKLVLRLLQGKV